jgi:RecA-family ATPase
VLADAPNLMEKQDALDVARAIVAAGGAQLVIVDTFAQVMPGANENAGEDVGRALAHCKGIHRATGALVLLVHHSGKDSSRGARGWSGLRAAADVELEVVRADDARSSPSRR